MDIKAALMEPKTWVTVGSVVLILILGLGPLMTGLEGGTDHPDSAHPELMESLSGEDKEAVVDIVNQNLFEFGLWNVIMCLMFLAMVYLTDGKTQAKLAMVAAASMILISGIGSYQVNGDAYFMEWVTLSAILAAPMLITGYMKLNAE